MPFFANSGSALYFMARVGTPAHDMALRAHATMKENHEIVATHLQLVRVALDLPMFQAFKIFHHGKRVDNVQLDYDDPKVREAVREKIQATKGKYGIGFRKKTEAYQTMLGEMEGCPELMTWGDALLKEIVTLKKSRGEEVNEIMRAVGWPSMNTAPNGDKVFAVGTMLDFNDWRKLMPSAGFEVVAPSAYMRVMADIEERREARRAQKAADKAAAAKVG